MSFLEAYLVLEGASKICAVTTQKAALRAFLAFPGSDEKAPVVVGGFWRRVGPPAPGWIDPPAVASHQQRALFSSSPRDAPPDFWECPRSSGVAVGNLNLSSMCNQERLGHHRAKK